MKEEIKIVLSIILGGFLLCALFMFVVWLCDTGIILYIIYVVFGLCAVAMALIVIYFIYILIDNFYG